MRKIEQEELKKIEFEILKDVAKFCDENGIRYYLAYGTLLGAIRHKGFIPWDDDIDIIMPRLDYMKFVNSFNKKTHNSNLFVNSSEISDKYPNVCAKVFDSRTSIDEYLYMVYENNCVYIDIFPIENVPDNIKIYNKYYQRINFYKKIYILKMIKTRKGRKFYKKLILFFGRNVFRFISHKKIAKKVNTIAETINSLDSESEYARSFLSPYKEPAFSHTLFEPIEVEFEGVLFKAPKGYHEYLTKIYGDYMTPPPPEKQKSHHNFEAYWKE